MTPEEQLIEDIGSFSRDPLGYVKYAFPWGEEGELSDFDGPYEWQREILSIIGEHLQGPEWDQPIKIAVSSGRGIGKSALIGMITHWAKDTCDDCRVVVTANTEDQLATKTWPEIIKWCRRAITDHWWNAVATKISTKDKKHADTWRVDRQTWSENNIEAFRGLHNIGKRMVIIFDEAAGIPTAIWQATEGSLTDEKTEMIWIAFSNPSQTTGSFSECFGRFKHRWIHKTIDSRDVPGTNKEEIQRWLDDYGEDSDYFRVNVKGEFPRAGSTQFISGEVVTMARKRKVEPDPREWGILSVDVARFGDDLSVIGYRKGAKLVVLERLRGLDTQQVGARVCHWMKQLTPRMTVIDGDGVGGGVVDYVNANMQDWMKENKPCRVDEFHGGNTPGDTFAYFNRRAEVWGKMKEWLETADIPDDPDLDRDLTGVQYGFTNKNQIQLEKKEDMKKRGLSSPDIGDMIAMSFSTVPTPQTRQERLAEEIQACKDPMERHFMQLRNTAQREKDNQPLNFWE